MPTFRTPWIGVIFAFAAACSYAGLNAAIRFADAHMSIWHIIFYRSLFGVAAMVVLAWVKKCALLGCQRITLCLAGISGATGITALTLALTLLPLFEALVLLYLFPAFAALLSLALTDDHVGGRDWLLIATACCGAAVIFWPGQKFDGLAWGHLLGLLSSFSLGLTFTLIRRVSAVNNPLTPFFYICAAGAIVSFGPVWMHSAGVSITGQGIPALAMVAILATSAHLFSNSALTYLTSPRVGVILMSEVVFGVFIGWVVFGELVEPQKLFGGLMIIGSGIGFNVAQQET
jgi:drug/metabolite transporter (DMT)-like permease